MNSLKLMGIMLLSAASFGVTLTTAEAKAADVSICLNGICIARDRDGSGLDLRPDYRRPPRPPRHRPPPPPRRPRPVPPPRYPWPNPYPGYEFIRCESRSQRYAECYFNPHRVRSVELDRVHSGAPCILGRTYGIYRDRVWVQNGCRATFVIDRY